MQILTVAARTVLRQMTTRGHNYVTEGDLISEGWLGSMRHGSDDTSSGGHFAMAVRKMRNAWRWLEHEQCYVQKRPKIRPWPDSDDETHLDRVAALACDDGQWGTRCIDIWDYIGSRTNARTQDILRQRTETRNDPEIACRIGLTRERVRQLRHGAKDVVLEAIGD